MSDDRLTRMYALTALTDDDRERLSELTAEWQMLADLSFADLILWVPKRKDYLSWPEGYVITLAWIKRYHKVK